MKKINLMDIMESLNNDNHEDAHAALHEWFVDQSKNVQARLSGQPVVEAEPEAPMGSQDDSNKAWAAEQFVALELQDAAGVLAGSQDDEAALEHGRKEFWDQMFQDAAAKGIDKEDLIAAYHRLCADEEFDAHEDTLAGDPKNYVAANEAIVDEADGDEADTPATPATPGKIDYSEVELIDDDEFEIEDEMGYELDEGKPGGIIKGVRWSRTGITGDVAWLAFGDPTNGMPPYNDGYNFDENAAAAAVEKFAAQHGLHNSDFTQIITRLSDGIEDEKAAYAAVYNVSGQPQYQTESAKLEAALIAELAESFKGLETVSDKLQNVEGAQVGEQGKVPVNTKDTVPHHKGADRIAGKPVEIKGAGHKGHDREKAPKVADIKVKGTVQNGKEELKKVADKGDASALLNKMDGKVNTQSPISGKGAKGLKK